MPIHVVRLTPTRSVSFDSGQYRTRRYGVPVRNWWVAAGYLAGFVAVTVALLAESPLIDLDLAARAWSEAHRPAVVETAARAANLLGQGTPLLVVAIGLAGWLAGRVRTVRPLLFVLAAAVLLVPTVLITKAATQRGAPSSTLPPEQAVQLLGPLPPDEYAAGYPSGHVANTVVWYGVVLLLLAALLRSYGRGAPARWLYWTVRIVPVVLVFAATTYLSFHWLTDSLAGLLLGLAIDRLLSSLRLSTF